MIETFANAIVPAHVQPVFAALYVGLAMLAAAFLISRSKALQAADEQDAKEDAASPSPMGWDYV